MQSGHSTRLLYKTTVAQKVMVLNSLGERLGLKCLLTFSSKVCALPCFADVLAGHCSGHYEFQQTLPKLKFGLEDTCVEF